MTELLKSLCELNGASGDETRVREFIISRIEGQCEYRIDALGNIIALKKGRKNPKKKVMIAAHMDEVGFIVTGITPEGCLKLATVGGIDPRTFFGVPVLIGEKQIPGVIGGKAVHHLSENEKDSAPAETDLFADIGAGSREEAQKAVSIGDFAYFESAYTVFGSGFIKAKALDDRVGCAVMIELIASELEYDTYFVFNVQEEVGLRGAKVSAFSVNADIAIVLECTTAADLSGVSGEKRVCVAGGGPAVSFMDSRTIYSKRLCNLAFEIAEKEKIPCQTKTAVAGGNDSGAIHLSRCGVETLALSVPCRYIHTASSVIKGEDVQSLKHLLSGLLEKIYD